MVFFSLADDLLIQFVRAHRFVKLFKSKIVHVFFFVKNASLDEFFSFFQQSLLVDEIAIDDEVFGIFPITSEVADAVDHLFRFSCFLFPVRQLPDSPDKLLFFFKRFLSPLLKFLLAGIRRKVFDVAQNHGDEHIRVFTPARSRQINFSGTAHAVFVEIGLDRVMRLLSALYLSQSIHKVLRLCVLQIVNDLWIRANHIGNIEERQPHFRRNVVWH